VPQGVAFPKTLISLMSMNGQPLKASTFGGLQWSATPELSSGLVPQSAGPVQVFAAANGRNLRVQHRKTDELDVRLSAGEHRVLLRTVGEVEHTLRDLGERGVPSLDTSTRKPRVDALPESPHVLDGFTVISEMSTARGSCPARQ
jgi:hypothetical protein